jgi:ADP-ribosylglycohydrolase
VAAIAGALVGARWGASCVPREWRRAVRGWPGLEADDLVRLGREIARGGAAFVTVERRPSNEEEDA